MTDVHDFKSAKCFLEKYFFNDCKYNDFLENLKKPLDSVELNVWKDVLESFLTAAFEDLIIHSEDFKFNLSLKLSLECVLFTSYHHIIMPLIHIECAKEDNFLYEKCVSLSEKNVTAEQLGSKEDYAIPLYAGIVELASIDNRKTPLEKMMCICTTYDLIYAELKSAIAEFISETSELENEIPIVEHCDILPVLTTVIIKSKLLHAYSNLYYMNMFLWTTADAENVSHILEMFRTAIEKISFTTEENLRPSSAKNCKELDLKTTFEIINEIEQPEKRKSESLLDLQRRKIAEQIQKASNI